jgi:hypothetical protein
VFVRLHPGDLCLKVPALGKRYNLRWFARCIPLVNALFFRSRLPLELIHEVVAIRRIIAIVMLTLDISVLDLSSLRIPTKKHTYSYTVANYAAIDVSFGKNTISYKGSELKTDKVLERAAGVIESGFNLFHLSVRKEILCCNPKQEVFLRIGNETATLRVLRPCFRVPLSKMDYRAFPGSQLLVPVVCSFARACIHLAGTLPIVQNTALAISLTTARLI